MPIADNAIWIIERNLDQPITLNSIAEACGISRSHLANAFGTATGLSVMKYLRARRLSNAARVLADGAPDILAVALGAGYGSHEAFTRAFREQFGRTPESVRDNRSLAGLDLVEPLELKAGEASHLAAPRIGEEGLLRAVGLSAIFSFTTTIGIPAQWQLFMDYYDAIPAKLDRIPIGISQAPDDNGQFPYICAVEVSRFGDIPQELVKHEIPPRAYAVFKHQGHVSRIYETYRAIWNEALPAQGLAPADAPAIERHNPAFDPGTGEGGVALWIPLERRR
jgi:AraC family transcriptional regulator